MTTLPPSPADVPDRDPASLTLSGATNTLASALAAALHAAKGASEDSTDLATLFGRIGDIKDATPEAILALIERLRAMSDLQRQGADLQAQREALNDGGVRAQRESLAILKHQLLALGVKEDALANKSMPELTTQLTKVLEELHKAQTGERKVQDKALQASLDAARREHEKRLAAAGVTALLTEKGTRAELDHRHVVDLERKDAEAKKAYAQTELPKVVAKSEAAASEDLDKMERGVRLLTTWAIPALTTVSAAGSGYFTYQAFKSMKAVLSAETGFTGADEFDPVAAMAAGLINGGTWALAMGVQKGVLTMNPFATRRNPDGSKKLIPAFHGTALAVIAAHIGFSFISATSNIGGAAATSATDMVVSGAWAENDDKARQFIETAEGALEPALADVSGIITGIQDDGRQLVMESKGQWSATGRFEYGYETRSGGEMRQLLVSYKAAAEQVVAHGDCSGLEDLQNVGFHVVDQLEAERKLNPAFAPGVGSFDRAPFDLSRNIARCKELNPDRMAQLEEVEVKLDEVREKINRGEVLDTYALNLVVRELNPILRDVASKAGIDPIQLEALDPLAQEGAILSWENAERALQVMQGQTPDQRISWTLLVLTILMGLIDQVGMMGAFYSKFAETRVREAYANRRGSLINPRTK